MNSTCCAKSPDFEPLYNLSLFKTTKTSSTKIRETIITLFSFCTCFFSPHPASSIQHPASIIHHPSSRTQHPSPITQPSNIEQYTASLYTPHIEWIYKIQTKDIQGIVKSTHLFSVIVSCFSLNPPHNRHLQNKEH